MRGGAALASVHGVPPLVEGDGVLSGIFSLLWLKDAISNTSPHVRIPDTVVYKYRVPAAWYFTAKDGMVKRKLATKMTNQHIFAAFSRKVSASKIAAVYLHDAIPPEGGKARTVVEYLDVEQLREFLFSRDKLHNGVLQRWLDPQGDRNSTIRAMWSPMVTVLEKLVNKVPLYDRRYDAYERAATFEGAEFLCDVAPVRGSTLPGAVHQLATTIVEHVSGTSGDRVNISRFCLHLKLTGPTENPELTLRWVSSCRLADERQRLALRKGPKNHLAEQGINNTPLDRRRLGMPEHVRVAGSAVPSAPAVLQQRVQCHVCDRPAVSLWELRYGALVKHAEEITKEPGVPHCLRKLHPRLTDAEYLQIRHEPIFAFKAAKVSAAAHSQQHFSVNRCSIREYHI
jgi:hypothetical protein